jgi:hypothetical protein
VTKLVTLLSEILFNIDYKEVCEVVIVVIEFCRLVILVLIVYKLAGKLVI